MKSSNIACLMPAYNTDLAFLRTAINSVLAQTRNVDLFIVDDGSTVPVSELFKDKPQIRIIRLPENQGVTRARNIGLQSILEAGYDYIACLDSDDDMRPDRIEIQMRYLEENPSVSLIGALAPAYDLDGKFLFTYGVKSGPDFVGRRVRYSQPFSHSTFMFRSQLVREIGLYSTDYPAAEDYEFLLRAVSRGYKVDCLPVALAIYRFNPEGITVSNWRRQKRMRLKAQLRYFAPFELASYMGVASTFVSMMMPMKFWNGIKKIVRPLPSHS